MHINNMIIKELFVAVAASSRAADTIAPVVGDRLELPTEETNTLRGNDKELTTVLDACKYQFNKVAGLISDVEVNRNDDIEDELQRLLYATSCLSLEEFSEYLEGVSQ